MKNEIIKLINCAQICQVVRAGLQHVSKAYLHPQFDPQAWHYDNLPLHGVSWSLSCTSHSEHIIWDKQSVTCTEIRNYLLNVHGYELAGLNPMHDPRDTENGIIFKYKLRHQYLLKFLMLHTHLFLTLKEDQVLLVINGYVETFLGCFKVWIQSLLDLTG